MGFQVRGRLLGKQWLLSLPLHPAPSLARRAINFACTLAARCFSAFPTRPSAFAAFSPKIGRPNPHFSGSFKKPGAGPNKQVPPTWGARRKSRAEKEIHTCIRTAFPSSASSATTYR